MLLWYLGCFLWGLAEATVFFLVPDLFVGAAAILFPWRWYLFALEALVGALAGSALVHQLAGRDAPTVLSLIQRLPGHPPAFVDTVREDFLSRGWAALLSGGVRGRPFKIYALDAGAAGRGLFLFLLVGGLARALRLFAVAFLASRWSIRVSYPVHAERDAAVFFGAGLLLSVAYLWAVERRYRRKDALAA